MSVFRFPAVCIGFMLLWMLPGCEENAGAGGKSGTKPLPYFDLAGYMATVGDSLSRLKSLSRRMMVDGQWEDKVIDDPDLADDLGLFVACDINKPAWSDKYSKDTTWNTEGALVGLEHKALDPSMRTKTIRVQWEDGKVRKVHIEYGSENILIRTSQTLEWEANKGYAFHSRQELPVFRIEHEYGITASIVR